MRALAIAKGFDRQMVCAAYAQAEREGIVVRDRNKSGRLPEEYAVALWENGIKMGWLLSSDAPTVPAPESIETPETKHIKSLSVPELLVLHAQIGEKLRERGVVRSANNPTGDLAEYLFCRAFGWEQAGNSERGYDAVGEGGMRYQIKGRRIHRRNKSRQRSAIRDIQGGHFDVLEGVLFDENFDVIKAALIPYALVVDRSTYIDHTNSNKFILRDDVWHAPGVRDVSIEVMAAMP